MTIELSFIEIENLLLMNEFCKRWFDHPAAKSAVAKLDKARKEYVEQFERQAVLFRDTP